MNKYEQLIEYIINEDESKAKALFHSIVVERSRDIYESLMDEEGHAMVHDDQVSGLVDEITADHNGMHEDDEEVAPEMGGDDMGDEEGMDDMGGEEGDMGDMDDMGDMGGEEEIEDRVMGLEDAIDELRAEFQRLMGGEEGGHEGGEEAEFGGDMGSEEADDEIHTEGKNPFAKSGSGKSGSGSAASAKSGKAGSGSAASGKAGSGNPFAKGSGKAGSGSGKKTMTETERLREYVDKVSDGHGAEKAGDAEGKTVGTGGDAPTVNKNSIVAKKNDMGGTSANIAKGGSETAPDGKQYSKPKNEYSKGETSFSNEQFKNAPGNKKIWDKKETSGHGAEKKSGAEGKQVGSDGSRPVDKSSIIGGKIR